MNMKDIAKMANVSVSTVSRVLSDRDCKAAKKEVRELIWDIVRETGYVPNKNAQFLRSKDSKSKEVKEENKYYACIFARTRDNKDMFFSQLSSVIEAQAFKRNYLLKYSIYANNFDEESFKMISQDSDISGIIVLGRFDAQKINLIVGKMKNVVYVGLNHTSDKHDSIICDGYHASIKAMETLFEFGHVDIAYIGEIKNENRYLGYYDYLKKKQIQINKEIIIKTEQTLDGGYTGCKDLISRNQTYSAVFCANDALAMGCIKAFKERGIKVPDDVSVISIDDVEMAQYFTPMLTTIHIPIDELGKHAVRTMIDRVEKEHKLPIKIELPFYLAKRESCRQKD